MPRSNKRLGDGLIRPHPEYGALRPGHSHVGEKSRPARQNLFVRRLGVGMGAEQRRNPPVRVVGQGFFLRRGFRVKIHHTKLGTSRFLQQPIQRLERARQRLHVYQPDKIDNRQLVPALIHYIQPPARRARGIIGRPQYIGRLVQHFVEFPPSEGVVAAGNHVRPAVQDVGGRRRRDAVAVGRVFAVDDADVHAVLPLHHRQHPAQMLTARTADHVADT